MAIRLFDALTMRHAMSREGAILYAAACHMLSGKIQVRVCPPPSQYGLDQRAGEVRRCEFEVVDMLGGRLMMPTVRGFLRLFHERYAIERLDRGVIGFFADVAVLAFDLLDYRPSLVAMAVLALGTAAVGHTDWARDALERSQALLCPDLLPALQTLQRHVIAAREEIRGAGRHEAIQTLDRARLPVDVSTLGL
jgi:hypothetical protein